MPGVRWSVAQITISPDLPLSAVERYRGRCRTPERAAPSSSTWGVDGLIWDSTTDTLGGGGGGGFHSGISSKRVINGIRILLRCKRE